MKTVIAAIGALALVSTAAQAAPARSVAMETGGHGYHLAAGLDHYRSNDTTRYRTPNQGAGTSRTSDANQG